MKFTALILAALLALCGCAAQTEPVVTTPPVETIPATEPAGIYDASSYMEQQTAGAIKAYPLALCDAVGIVPIGDDILLFSGMDTTTLARLRGETLYIDANVTLDCSIRPDDAAVHADESGVVYYDNLRKELVFLDTQLEEVSRVDMPENLTGVPALSADRSKLYYCTADALRCMDLDTKLDRLIKEMYFRDQSVEALHCNDTVIACNVLDDDLRYNRLYINVANGALIYEDQADILLQTHGASYFAQHKDGIYNELLIGDSEQGPTLLTPHTYDSVAFPLLEIGGAVMLTEDATAKTVVLDYYDLYSSRRTSSITLRGPESLRCFRADGKTGLVWFLAYDPRYGCDTLYCWDLSKSTVEDSRNCFSARYTFENPDLDGLFACREIADRLSETYGVQVLLWTDATTFQPWDYTLVPEYQVRVIRKRLGELEQFLAMYPDGFLAKAAERTTSGRIQICLVRSILGKDDVGGSVAEAVGLQYWDQNRNAYLCLSVKQDRFVQNACHEMSHIIDSRVLTFCKAYDDWNKLNPAGFTYDLSYVKSLPREESQWIEGDRRAFIDSYSMSYPKEDRARIMEYAMMDQNESLFESETMQKKLRQLSLGIREAFGLKKSTETFRWEQYLKEPLNQK